ADCRKHIGNWLTVPLAASRSQALRFRSLKLSQDKESRMAKSAALSTVLAGCLLLTPPYRAAAQQATPSVETMLEGRFAPKQKDIAITTPAPAELKSCTVRAVSGTRAGSTGWELLDAKNQPVRRYFGGKG